MAQNRETRTVAHPAMLAVGARQDVMVWKQPVGLFRALEDPDRKVLVGTPGQSDTMAVVAVTITPDMVGKTIGVAVAPEFKTTKGKQSDRQKLWQAAFEKRGGIYALIRSPAEMIELVQRVQRGNW
jgi:hypothetical protein